VVAAASGGDDADRLPGPDDAFFGPMLDYAAEDESLARHGPV
jgi:hypothetical protein